MEIFIYIINVFSQNYILVNLMCIINKSLFKNTDLNFWMVTLLIEECFFGGGIGANHFFLLKIVEYSRSYFFINFFAHPLWTFLFLFICNAPLLI